MRERIKSVKITGFCDNRFCEGTKPKSASGKPMRTCEAFDWCECKCHREITEMFQMVDMPRPEPEQTAEYLAMLRTARAEFVMPSRWESIDSTVLSSSDGTDIPPEDEGTVATPYDAPAAPLSTGPQRVIEPVFAATPTGRRARGQLEYDVLTVCDEFSRDVYEWEYCTPKLVAERIGVMNQSEPPSTGPINAVWDRWEKIGFAKQDKKPSRFVGFVIDGSLPTLMMLKNRVKVDKKRTQRDMRHGVRRQ